MHALLQCSGRKQSSGQAGCPGRFPISCRKSTRGPASLHKLQRVPSRLGNGKHKVPIELPPFSAATCGTHIDDVIQYWNVIVVCCRSCRLHTQHWAIIVDPPMVIYPEFSESYRFNQSGQSSSCMASGIPLAASHAPQCRCCV